VSGAKLECQTNNRRIKCDVDGKALALEVPGAKPDCQYREKPKREGYLIKNVNKHAGPNPTIVKIVKRHTGPTKRLHGATMGNDRKAPTERVRKGKLLESAADKGKLQWSTSEKGKL
jgi:hypothetical protein